MSTTMNISLTTEKNRTMVYRDLNPGEVLDLILACGSDGAQNPAYMNTVQAWCGVREIDNIPVPFPSNRKAIRDLANMLSQDGIDAIVEYFSRNEDNKNEEQDIKN